MSAKELKKKSVSTAELAACLIDSITSQIDTKRLTKMTDNVKKSFKSKKSGTKHV